MCHVIGYHAGNEVTYLFCFVFVEDSMRHHPRLNRKTHVLLKFGILMALVHGSGEK